MCGNTPENRSAVVVFLTLLIGTLNLCLGYALAVYLGYGPAKLTKTWAVSSTKLQTGAYAIAAEESIEDVVEKLVSAPIEQMLDDEPDDDVHDGLQVEAYQPPGEEADEESEPVNPDAPENWDLNEKHIETSLLRLNVAMMKSGARATDIDTRLRASQGQSDHDTIQDCLTKLKEDCESYLNELAGMAEKFSSRIGELGELSELGEEIGMANLEQSAQVETTLSNLTHMDFESDLEAANRRLVEEIGNLRLARHNLRDSQELAFVTIARYEGRFDEVEKRLFNDPLTRLYNRIGLEATLCQWWQQDYPNSRQITAALFDVDGFSRIDEEHGPLAGDRILALLAQFIREKAGKLDLVGRYAGQRFLVAMLDAGPHMATKNAEMIRQSVEKIKFLSGDQEIRLTVAGGITEVSPDDTEEAVLERVEKALQEAKKGGPNRSFFHDGKEAELVESPDLRTQDIELQI